MPLLRKEIDILPEDIFEVPAAERPWGVAHVRSRQEKVLARQLAENGVPFYLPLAESRRRREGRTLVSHLPLFAGYVFHRATAAQRDILWRTNVIANLIDVTNQDELHAELAQLRRLQLAGASLKTYHELLPGQPVRIESGSFAGYNGIVVRGKGHDRLIVSISLLKQNVSVEFDREVLRRVRG
ncbi:MAG TPA: transcription termination/antitermination NusG family protein [Thermoanaerobaculia bacterium]|nr:transcription termination/antitermination NusG family protein [Thermoanaerobaculia bacterium]